MKSKQKHNFAGVLSWVTSGRRLSVTAAGLLFLMPLLACGKAKPVRNSAIVPDEKDKLDAVAPGAPPLALPKEQKEPPKKAEPTEGQTTGKEYAQDLIDYSLKNDGYYFIQTPLLTGTLSYYSRLSYDGRWIVYTESPGLTLTIQSIRTPNRRLKVYGPRGDGIFSPDGKLLTAISPHGKGSRIYYFYTWDNQKGVLGEEMRRVMKVGGYPTVAKIPMKGKVNYQLEKYRGKYIIMSKTMTYMIVDIVDDKVKVVGPHPSKLKSPNRLSPGLGPICRPKRSDRYYRKFLATLRKDAYNVMIAKNARYISLAQISNRSVKVLDTWDCRIIRDLRMPDGKQVTGGKATFSYDSRYIAFHSFGEKGGKRDDTGFIQSGRLKYLADKRLVVNIFVYDLFTNKMVQVTHHSPYKDTAAAVYPDWTADNQIVFNYHKRGEAVSRIRYYPNVLSLFESGKAVALSEKSIVNKPINRYILKRVKKQQKISFQEPSAEEWSVKDCGNQDAEKFMNGWQKKLCSEIKPNN